jgi:hypothetical protein
VRTLTEGPYRLGRRELLRVGGAALLAPVVPRLALAYRPETPRSPATLSGTVRYAGKVGRPPKVTFSGDCAWCRKFDIRVESLLVGRKGGLRNVVLMLEGIDRGKPVPETQPVLAERLCTFVPHVLSVTAGTKVVLHNQDPVLNTFHAIALPSGRTLFNIGMPNKGQKMKRRIRQRGRVQVRCDVHPWEEAYIVAADHPYHTVSDKDGGFVLAQVPPGSYTLALWHEKLGVRRQRVQLGPGAHLKLEITYPAVK